MKNFKVFTVAMFLMAAATTTFTSCGGGDSKEETAEEGKLESGTDYASQVAKAVKDGKIVLDETSAKELADMFKLELDEDEMEDKQKFDGYKLERNFYLYDGKLSSISYSTFSQGDNGGEKVEADGEKVVEKLKSILGKPTEDEDDHYTWVIDETIEISLNVYSSSGYDLNINEYYDYEDEDYSDGDDDCVGDYYTLKADLVDLFMANIKNGSIKLGTTTKSQMMDLVGAEDYLDEEYDGLRLSASMYYDGDKLSSVSLNYFYECDGAMSLLSMDKTGISSAIEEALGVTGKKDGTSEDATSTWTVGNQTVKQMNFSDGYSVYLDKK